MVMAEDDSLRLFLGYSGWAPNQIESEIEAGAWDVYRVDLEKLLSNLDKLAAANSDLLASYLDSIKAETDSGRLSLDHPRKHGILGLLVFPVAAE